MRKFLLCGAQEADGHWEAICLDLDIAAEGESFQDVQDRLNKAICIYIEQAMKQPDAVRDQLLNRKAPLWIRMRWVLLVIFANIFSRNSGGDDTPAMFSTACPA